MNELGEDALAAVIERVQQDLATTLGEEAALIRLTTGRSPDLLIRTTENRPAITGIYVAPDETEAQLLARVADAVQDSISESAGLWGVAWPQCPRHHAHPLTASDAPGRWICPATGDDIAVIGELPARSGVAPRSLAWASPPPRGEP